MYAWRCWREFRLRFFAYLTLALVAGLGGAAAVTVKRSPQGEWGVFRPAKTTEFEELWKSAGAGLIGVGSLAMILAAFGLGNSGVGADLDRRTAEFVLTLPRRRRHFFWTGWAAGVAALAAAAAAAMALAVASVWLLGGYIGTPRLYFLLPVLLTVSVVLYSLTQLVTVCLRNASRGASYSMGLVTAYLLLWALLDEKWDINLPTFGPLYRWVIGELDAFPAATLAGWWLVALALTFAGQRVFDRAEV